VTEIPDFLQIFIILSKFTSDLFIKCGLITRPLGPEIYTFSQQTPFDTSALCPGVVHLQIIIKFYTDETPMRVELNFNGALTKGNEYKG